MKTILRPLGILIGFLIGGLFIYLSLKSLDWATVRETLAHMNVGWILLAVPALACAFAIRLERWRAMLWAIGSKARRRDLAAPFLGSFALNNVLPLRLGDVTRAVAFRKQIGVSSSGALASLLVERVFDLYALLLIGFFALMGIGIANVPIDPDVIRGLLVSLGLVVVGLTAVLLLPRFFARLAMWFRRSAPGRLVPSVLWRFGIRTLLRISQIVRRSGSAFMMLLSVIAWLVEGFVVFACVTALAVPAKAAGSWLALVAANLGTLIPGTPGHFGTFHYIGSQGLSLAGPTFSEALPAITIAHLIIWMGITIAGFTALALGAKHGTGFAKTSGKTKKSHKSNTVSHHLS